MQLELNAQLLESLGLNPSGNYQVVPVVEHHTVGIAPGATVATDYTLFPNQTPNNYITTQFPNDNAYVFTELQMRSDAQFAALGGASTAQTQDWFERYSRLQIKQDTVDIMDLAFYEAGVANRYLEDDTLVTDARDYDFYTLPTSLLIGVREQVRFSFRPAPGGLTLRSSQAGANPFLYQYDGTNSAFFTLVQVKLRGAKIIAR